MKVHVGKGLPFTLEITDDQGNTVTVNSLFLAEDAKKHPLTREAVVEHLLRLGNVPFKAERVDVTIEGDIMVPFSEINEVRRRAIDLISQKRVEQGRPANIIDSVSFKENLEKFLSFSSTDKSKKMPLLSVAVENLEGVEAALYSGADLIYISSQTDVRDIEKGAFLCEEKGVPLVIRTPRVVRGKESDDLEELFKRVKDGLAIGVNVGDLGALYLALKMGLPTYTDFSLNPFNSATIRMLGKEGVEQVTLSLELSLAQLSALAKPDGVRFEVVVHGRFPMIISEHSLLSTLLDSRRSRNRWFGLKDRKGFVFPVKEDEYGRTHIFNSVKTCMIQHIPDLCSINLDFIRIETWGETPSDIAELTSVYKENLLAFDASPNTYTLNDRGVRLLERLNVVGITKGHYFRGVE
jgi:putative protease